LNLASGLCFFNASDSVLEYDQDFVTLTVENESIWSCAYGCANAPTPTAEPSEISLESVSITDSDLGGDEDSDDGLSGGAIAGIVIGVLALGAGVLAVFIFGAKSRGKGKDFNLQEEVAETGAVYPGEFNATTAMPHWVLRGGDELDRFSSEYGNVERSPDVRIVN
jgi:hypothetical protein